ncbi:MAG: hypothetical protein KatS3mg129_2657 [Leptospiraceae bacterium]|nr:MAG: hypothetical protein KatS3mg129_2657 [Leptospiraceae bacterium]
MKINKYVLTLFLVCFISGFIGFILLGHYPKPQNPSFRIDIPYLRNITETKKRPDRINKIFFGEIKVPLAFLSAMGTASKTMLKLTSLAYHSYVIFYKKDCILIDTPPENQMKFKIPFLGNFNSQNHSLYFKLLKKCNNILLTNYNNISNIMKYFDDSIKNKIFFYNKVNNPQETEYISPFPGIVIINTSRSTENRLMIYIRLKNEREYFITGDTVWNYQNIIEKRGRPNITNFFYKEDRDYIAEQLMELNRISKEYPEINIIIPHDKLVNQFLRDI